MENFYDTGYERLFQYAGGNEKCFYFVYDDFLGPYTFTNWSCGQKTDMVKVIFSTKSGKTGYYRDLFLYGILCGIFSATLFIFFHIFSIF